MNKSERELQNEKPFNAAQWKLNKKYIRYNIFYFSLINKLLIKFAHKSSKLLDKATVEPFRDAIMNNNNNIFAFIGLFEDIIRASKRAIRGEDITKAEGDDDDA